MCAAIGLAWLAGTFAAVAAQGSGARVTLLPVGSRASVVVEFDDGTPEVTAIESNDDQSVAVEIGPVHGKVLNQLLEAAQHTPLVSQVRVRGITRGADGTIMTIHVMAKAPVSGSVRLGRGRIYIDLEPLDTRGTTLKGRDRLLAGDAPRPTQTAGTAAAHVTPEIASPPKAPTPGPRPTPEPRRFAAVPATKPETESVLPGRLKSETAAQTGNMPTAGAEGVKDPRLVQIVERLRAKASQTRLLADAGLIPGEPHQLSEPGQATAPPEPATPPGAFEATFAVLVPELERLKDSLSQWQPGYTAEPTLQAEIDSLVVRLRALQPPSTLVDPLAGLFVALTNLASTWMPGPDGRLIPFRDDIEPVEGARAALDRFLDASAATR